MPKNKKRRVSSKENDNPRVAFLKKIMWGGLFSLISFFVMMLILAFIVVKSGISESMQNILVFFVSLLSTFTGTFLSLRKTREKGLLSGVITSLPVIVIVCFVLLTVADNVGVRTIIMSLLMMLGGALGGIAAVNK
ncbi:MAG: TIGR04086 family membrane protein [Clostridia bacterium]|nr:TIGR04086 family membrane protein [Clostridia bacterium]